MLDARILAGDPVSELEGDIERLVPVLISFYRWAGVTRLTADELMTVQEDQISVARDVLLHPRFVDYRLRVEKVLGKLEAMCPALAKILSDRVNAGAIVECHEDMRPEHVCLSNVPVT